MFCATEEITVVPQQLLREEHPDMLINGVHPVVMQPLQITSLQELTNVLSPMQTDVLPLPL
jgi:hypothetical protein